MSGVDAIRLGLAQVLLSTGNAQTSLAFATTAVGQAHSALHAAMNTSGRREYNEIYDRLGDIFDRLEKIEGELGAIEPAMTTIASQL